MVALLPRVVNNAPKWMQRQRIARSKVRGAAARTSAAPPAPAGRPSHVECPRGGGMLHSADTNTPTGSDDGMHVRAPGVLNVWLGGQGEPATSLKFPKKIRHLYWEKFSARSGMPQIFLRKNIKILSISERLIVVLIGINLITAWRYQKLFPKNRVLP